MIFKQIITKSLIIALLAALVLSVTNELIRPTQTVDAVGQKVMVFGVKAFQLRLEAFGVRQYMEPLLIWYAYLTAAFFIACSITGCWVIRPNTEKND